MAKDAEGGPSHSRIDKFNSGIEDIFNNGIGCLHSWPENPKSQVVFLRKAQVVIGQGPCCRRLGVCSHRILVPRKGRKIRTRAETICTMVVALRLVYKIDTIIVVLDRKAFKRKGSRDIFDTEY